MKQVVFYCNGKKCDESTFGISWKGKIYLTRRREDAKEKNEVGYRCHSREGGNPVVTTLVKVLFPHYEFWIPAFAGMTKFPQRISLII